MAQEHWRVPVRVDFAGGTLDLWPICAILEGCVTVNAALDLWIDLRLDRDGQGHQLVSRDLGESLAFPSWPRTAPDALTWVWRVLDATGRPPARVEVASPVPQGSGLGASSALAVGLLGAALELSAGPELGGHIGLLRDLESRELQAPAGWQDYFPPAYGGALALHWELPTPRVERLEPHPGLLESLVIFYTGKPHHSGLTNWEAYKRFIEGDLQTRRAMTEIRGLAQEMVPALVEDPQAVAGLLEREGLARAGLSPAVETDAMRAVRSLGRREGWYAGMKPCGAGGGGCCLLVARPGRKEDALAGLRALGLPPLDLHLTPRGLHRLA